MARIALRPTGDYWQFWNKEAADKFLWYRDQASQGSAPRIVIVGDSTAARNFIPRELERKCGGTAFNLGWPANFPLAFEHSTLPFLDAPFDSPEVVVFSMSPKSFATHERNAQFEAAILASAVARHSKGETLVSDFLYLTRLTSATKTSFGWFTGRGLFEEPPNQGAMPLDGREREPPQTADGGTRQVEKGVSKQRVGVLAKLVDLARRRQFKLVIVIPPREIEDRILVENEYIDIVRDQLQPSKVIMLDMRRVEELGREHFHDALHLNRDGATVFSRIVAEQLCGSGVDP